MKYKHSYGRTITKKDIATRIAKKNDIEIEDAYEWIDAVIEELRDAMMSDALELRIEIRDFGVFEVKLTRPKPHARNPKTGEIVFVPQRRKIHFKPGKILKQYLSTPIEEKPINYSSTSENIYNSLST